MGWFKLILLTTRQKNTLAYLLNNTNYTTIEHLSAIFSIGKRTVWNDLKQLDTFLSLQTNCYLDKKPRLGIKLITNENDAKKIKTQISTMASRVLTTQERTLLFTLLILTNDTVTYDYLADASFVSRQTAIRTLDNACAVFQKQNLKLEKKQGKGLYVVGEELAIRKLFESTIYNSLLDKTLIDIIYQYSTLNKHSSTTTQILENLNSSVGTTYIDSMKIEIIVKYWLYRISRGCIVCDNELASTNSIDEIDQVLYTLTLPEAECLYIKNVLFFTRIAHINNVDKELDDDATKMANYLIDKLHLLQEVNGDALSQIFDGFTQHLRMAIYRIKNKVPIENELLHQIKISIPLIYEFTKKELINSEKIFGIEFDEKEIAYISMYISSIYENSLAINTSIDVMLVCSFGLATSSILKSRIIPIMPNCKLIGPYGEKDAIEYCNQNSVDLIISTHDLSIDGIKTITVNPLLYPEDVDYIKSSLFQISYQRMCEQFITSYANIKDNREVHIWIKDYVSYDDIQIVDKQDSWSQAIHLAAKPLLDKGKIEQQYVNKMIEAVNKFGTYMVLVDGIAFIHAGTDDGINENCTSILLIKNPIPFGNKNTKIVKCLVILGIQNKEENSLLNTVCVFENKMNQLALDNKNISIDEIYEMHD